ncbi:MAG: AbrB family transcriptional regulator [Candidatus Puniceispirillaceae bacterium]
MIWQDIKTMTLTFSLALATGWLFFQIGFPAPYLMGSLFGVWLTGALIKPLSPYLGVARWFHIPVVLGLGVLIGGAFGDDILSKLGHWWDTVLLMLFTTIGVSVVSYQFLRHYCGYDKILSYFCCVPGGQAEAIIMARDLVEKDYVVALFHLVRVFIVFVSTPFLLAVIEGQSAVARSNDMLVAMPSLMDLPASDIMAFFVMAIGGYGFARVIKMPMAHLLGPLSVSSVAHYLGVVELPRVNEFVILAQLVIGGGIGARLSKVAFKELFGYFKMAVLNTMIVLTGYVSVAVFITVIYDTSFLEIWMAFVPGGLYEVTLLALVFGFDVAFIAFHHTTRVLLIFFTLPVFAKKLRS